MEGPNLRGCPRTLFYGRVELRVGKKKIRLDRVRGDLGIRGVFLHTDPLPVDTALRIKLVGAASPEMEGIVRQCDAEGLHIEFTGITEPNRRRLDDLIAELAQKEPLCAERKRS